LPIINHGPSHCPLTFSPSLFSARRLCTFILQVNEADVSPAAAALAALQSAIRACDVGAIDGVLSSPAAATAAADSPLHTLCVDARALIASIRSAQDAAIAGLRAAVNARDLPALEQALATAHACGDTWDGSSSKLAALMHARAAHHGHRYGTFEHAVYSSAHLTTLTAEARAIVAALHAAQDQLAASLRLALEKGDLVSLNGALSLVAGTSERSLSAHHELQALKLAVGAQIAALRAQQAAAVVALEQAIVARQSADLRAALLRASTAPESNQINALSAVAHVLLAEIVAAQSQVRDAWSHTSVLH
jgi:hypothetical protein